MFSKYLKGKKVKKHSPNYVREIWNMKINKEVLINMKMSVKNNFLKIWILKVWKEGSSVFKFS